ncbi:MAG TPA: helix-turn-helix domain-containing protein [Gudongella oleilytica]|jgi:hypothetical protein|nr:helix-turn-helix domain-containing protein [Gudongella oleilytica]
MIIKAYLKENIDEQVTIDSWSDKSNLPIALRNGYEFYEMNILENQCILMEAVGDLPNIDQLQKHIKQIKNLTEREIVLFYKEITRYRRKSLIENRISFIIEDGQMYMPFMGLDLKKVPEQVEKVEKYFTPPAQIAYLYFLYHKDSSINMTEFAREMGFNKMTASRALNELYKANLITYEIGGRTGRSKEYKRIPDPEYFLKGREYLKTPVNKLIYSRENPIGSLSAGLDALSKLSMINPPRNKVVAIDKNKLKTIKLEIIQNNDFIKDKKLVEIELWNYDPKLFSNKQYVDLLSLYTSLKDNDDERVEQALEEVLRGETWYTD